MEENIEPAQNSGRKYLYVVAFLVVLAIAGGVYVILGNKKDIPQTATLPVSTSSGNISPLPTMNDSLQIQDEIVGSGAEATAGKTVSVNYVGTLTDGKKFDSSYDRNQPFSFKLGAGEVIKGWDIGVSGMKVGGKRKLTIPSGLAYGDNGIPGAIPGGATLIFEVELLKVE